MKNISYLCVCALIIVSSLNSIAQGLPKLDSLSNLLSQHTESDTSRVRLLNNLAAALSKDDATASQPIAEEALELAKSLNDIKGQSFCYYLLGGIYTKLNERDKAINAAELCNELSKKIGDKEQVADVNTRLGDLYARSSKEKAREYFQKSIDIGKELDYQKGIAQGIQGLGNILRSEGEYEQARSNYETNLEISQSINDKNGIRNANNGLAIIEEILGNYDKALEYYLKALPISEDLGKYNNAKILNNIGSFYTAMKNYTKALDYLNQALDIWTAVKDKGGIAFAMQDIADVYRRQAKLEPDSLKRAQLRDKVLTQYNQVLEMRMQLGDKRGQSFTHINLSGLYNQKQLHSKALYHAKKSLALREEIGLTKGISRSMEAVGSGYMNLKQYDLAIPLMKKSLQLAEDIGSPEETLVANNMLSICYEKMNNYRLALYHHQVSKTIRDSLYRANQSRQVAEMETLYETEKKEKQIALQHNDIMELETRNAAISRQRNYVFGGASLLGLLAFLGIRINKIRNERNDKIEFAEALLYTQEEERKRIASDLHDSIGQSLLLLKKELISGSAVSHQNQALITNTLEEVRMISHDLHPFQLEKFGLTTTLSDTLENIKKTSDIFVSKDIANIDGLLSDKAEIHIYRVVQESLSNIIKHAKATAANLTIQNNDSEVQIIIKDNGVGYDHEYALATSKSLGLKTMYERISSIGGKLTVKQGDPSGTIIEMKIPKAS